MRVFGGPQEREDGHLTEWDRFARAEYVRLSMEEEGDDGGGTDMLEDSLDAPF
jgi:serine/threonine-protein phosphatase 2A regulatory subunit B''